MQQCSAQMPPALCSARLPKEDLGALLLASAAHIHFMERQLTTCAAESSQQHQNGVRFMLMPGSDTFLVTA